MSKIYVAADSAFVGGINPAGHLQIVYDDGSGSLVETEVQAPGDVGIFGGNWVYAFNQPHNANPPGEKYGIYELTLREGQSAANFVWELLEQVYDSLKASTADFDIDYDTLTIPSQNSNSYVRTLLDVIGNSVDWSNAFGDDGMTLFPGYPRNVLLELSSIGDDGVPLSVAGTAGNDIINGGNNVDTIGGQSGDDTLRGAGNEDILTGGSGKDLFLGTPGELNNDTIVDLEIGDRIGLSGETVEQADVNFAGGAITINADDGFFDFFGSEISINATVPAGASLRVLDETLEDGGSIIEVVGSGQDIAFVIDTTGSMFDDIAAVKSSASSIIDAVFNPERGFANSRIAVVGFNDPSTETILSFTDQADPEERKVAALNAINSITVGGGGDFSEYTYSGLLRALDGRAGEWRPEATARKIVLFGDATAKDGFLAPQVYALAADLNADISAGIRTASLAEGIGLASFTALETDAETGEEMAVPVQIFTVAIGSNPATLAEYEEIASATGGQAFTAAGASEIVDAIIEAIETPAGNTPPVAEDDVFTVNEDEILNGNVLVDNGNGADSDDDGDAISVTLVGGPDEGILVLNGDGTFTYEADADAFDVAVPGTQSVQTFTYQVDDGKGGSAQATATLTVQILNDGQVLTGDNKPNSLDGTDGGEDTIKGGNGNDAIKGLDGADRLYGENGNDKLYGGESIDRLFGGNGNDLLDGGDGNDFLYGELGDDILTGGLGKDQFWFGKAGGIDTITDFTVGEDLICVSGIKNATSFAAVAITQVGANTVLDMGGTHAILSGIESSVLTADDFLFA